MDSHKVLVIVNPSSASGKTGKRWPQIATHVKRLLPQAEIQMTQYAGHATDIAQHAVTQGYKQLVAVGGDGTIHEVLNGLFDEAGNARSKDIILSPLPMGTGSDLCRSLGIPRDPKDAVKLLTQPAQKVDVGYVQFYNKMPTLNTGDIPSTSMTPDHYSKVFLNIGSFGLSGAVAKHFELYGKGGGLSYFMGVLKTSNIYQNCPVELTLTLDNGEQQLIHRTLYTCAVANAQYFGNGMHVAPHACVNDRKFECVIIGDLNPLEVVRRMPALYQGKHLSKPKFESYQVLKVHMRSKDPKRMMWVELDGELSGISPAEFSILPQALQMTVGQQAVGINSRIQ